MRFDIHALDLSIDAVDLFDIYALANVLSIEIIDIFSIHALRNGFIDRHLGAFWYFGIRKLFYQYLFGNTDIHAPRSCFIGRHLGDFGYLCIGKWFYR